jgi:mono/diheme cytochrome c family protein
MLSFALSHLSHNEMIPRSARLGRASVALLAALITTAVGLASESAESWPPASLRETGLYADWTSRTVAAENLPFSPQYPLWSDGAAKSRWIHLPPGTFIDASNPDVWQFPVGTRLWKEFRFERRAETRFMELTADGWQFATYQWTEDEADAVLAPEMGIKRSVPIRDGIRHAIPSRIDCRACHEAGPVRVLGVTALQLSPDRDPNAPHAEVAPPNAVDLRALVARGLVRNMPAARLASPPRIMAATPTARAALGYLHANCGGCHSDSGELQSLAFTLHYDSDHPSSQAQRILLTSVGQPSRFKLAAAPDTVERICAGQPEKSVLVARMASRDPVIQMPPLGTRLVDEDAVRLITRWIAEDLGSRTPAAVSDSATR